MDEGYYRPPKSTMTTKRKGSDDVNGDFSDFSLSSPARKIRRLNADLPPIVEEDEHEVPIITFGHDSAPEEHVFNGSAFSGGLKIEELPSVPENNERAIVLFNHNSIANPLSLNPSNFLVSVNPQLVSGLKNQMLWSNDSASWKLAKEHSGLTKDENDSTSGDASLAVVPWVPSHNRPEVSLQIENLEMIEANEVEGSSDMEVENDNLSLQQSNVNEANGMTLNEGLHQWQQQLCMIPQPPNNTATSLFWYR